jgi:hypothetical protein
MLFVIVLGIVVGGAGVLLLQQWLSGSLMLGRDTTTGLEPARFPRLARPTPRRRAA